MFYDNFLRLCRSVQKSPSRVAEEIGTSRASVNRWKNGSTPTDTTIQAVAEYFSVSVSELLSDGNGLIQPNVTENIVRFPVLGDVAAGYDKVAYEDWTGDTVEIPSSYLKGRPASDFFVLRVVGSSMYPTYQDGDRVLVLRQSTMDYPGQIGVVAYNDDFGTLKRVDYVMGEDWMKLSPINPQYEPIRITDEALEHCRVLGIPKMLIREIYD